MYSQNGSKRNKKNKILRLANDCVDKWSKISTHQWMNTYRGQGRRSVPILSVRIRDGIVHGVRGSSRERHIAVGLNQGRLKEPELRRTILDRFVLVLRCGNQNPKREDVHFG